MFTNGIIKVTTRTNQIISKNLRLNLVKVRASNLISLLRIEVRERKTIIVLRNKEVVAVGPEAAVEEGS